MGLNKVIWQINQQTLLKKSQEIYMKTIPSLSVSSWDELMTVGQLSFVFWWPSPSLNKKDKIQVGWVKHGNIGNKQFQIMMALPVYVVVTSISNKVIIWVRLQTKQQVMNKLGPKNRKKKKTNTFEREKKEAYRYGIYSFSLFWLIYQKLF